MGKLIADILDHFDGRFTWSVGNSLTDPAPGPTRAIVLARVSAALQRSNGDSAISGSLDLIERSIGIPEEMVRSRLERVEGCYSGTERQPIGTGSAWLEHSPCESGRGLEGSAGQQQGELVAADPADDVGTAGPLAQRRTCQLQRRVAGEMAVGVVDPLEVIDICDHEAQRRPIPERSVDFVDQPLIERTVIEASREEIRGGQHFQVMRQHCETTIQTSAMQG